MHSPRVIRLRTFHIVSIFIALNHSKFFSQINYPPLHWLFNCFFIRILGSLDHLICPIETLLPSAIMNNRVAESRSVPFLRNLLFVTLINLGLLLHTLCFFILTVYLFHNFWEL